MDADGTELAAAGCTRSKQTLWPVTHFESQEQLAGKDEEDSKEQIELPPMIDLIYAVEMRTTVTDEVAQGIAAGQNGNARNSVISVYVCMGR
jgi:hypothetical protein